MKYNDPVYGMVEINEPIILDLIKSAPILRLKHITQHGPTVYNRNFKNRIITRFEHSLGVYIFLKEFGCSKEEQIAGLLHDVGHAVFSHVADLLFPHEEDSFDDRNQSNVIGKSEIPKILKDHNFDIDFILKKENFPILEKSLPNLCADRIDYFFRDISLLKDINIKSYIKNMKEFNKNIVFNNSEIALDFASKYMEMDKTFWADNFQEYLYAVLARVITIALRKNVLSLKDLDTTEDDVMDILMLSQDEEIIDLLDIMLNCNPSDIDTSYSARTNFFRIKSKVRIVDPLVVLGKETKRVSEIFPDFKKKMLHYRKEASSIRWMGFKN
jgi:hypothetical protein